MSGELNAIRDAIRDLSPPDKLRLAAMLLETKKPELAKTIIDQVGTELGAALLLAKTARV